MVEIRFHAMAGKVQKETGRIRDHARIRPITAVYTAPVELQVRKCSHGPGRIRDRNVAVCVDFLGLYSMYIMFDGYTSCKLLVFF